MDGVYLLHQPFRRKYSSFLLLNSEIPLRFQLNNSGIFSKIKRSLVDRVDEENMWIETSGDNQTITIC